MSDVEAHRARDDQDVATDADGSSGARRPRATEPEPPSRSAVDLSAATERSTGWRAYLRALGPGLITGASDDDPSGIATYAQAGAQFRFGLLWTALLTFPLMATVQETCDRTALATGRSLGALARQRFGKAARIVVGVLIVALLVANVLNIAADVLAVGSGMELLHAGPQTVWALVAGTVLTVAIMSGSFEFIARGFKVLCAALLAYLVVLFFAQVDWPAVMTHALVPHFSFSRNYLALFIAVIGTTISPYLFFWQNAHRIEELRDEPVGGDDPIPLDERADVEANQKQRTSRVDVITGMAFSNVVMFAIIVATASTLGAHGSVQIDSAAHAARALRPVAGSASTALFALGFIGSGCLAIPVLAGAGSAGMAGLLGKRWGFSRSIREAPLFYALVAGGTVGGTLLSLFGVNPITLLIVVAVINGLAAAPFLIVVMLIARNRRLMGDYANGRLANTLGWLTVTLMTVAAVGLVGTLGH